MQKVFIIVFWFSFISIVVPIFIKCNSTKKVLRDPEKIQTVVNKYLQKAIIKSDTVVKFVEGQTIVKSVQKIDTLYQYEYHNDTTYLTKTKVLHDIEYRFKTDTVKEIIHDNKFQED